MSIIKLSNGKFLIIDTVPLDDELRQELDALVGEIGGGNRIEAVVATHPFHTLAFPGFHKAFPNIPYYGTPRHIRKQPEIPWVGDVSKDEVLKKWEPDVYMRIPEGSEFVAPVPEDTNHFNSVWVFHPTSKTVHIDDTVMYWSNPETLLRLAAGKRKGLMELHLSVTGPGILSHPDAPGKFKAWCQKIITDWDFDNMVCAHNGNKIGGAKQAFVDLIANSDSLFDKLKEKRLKNAAQNADNSADDDECRNYNVEGAECG